MKFSNTCIAFMATFVTLPSYVVGNSLRIESSGGGDGLLPVDSLANDRALVWAEESPLEGYGESCGKSMKCKVGLSCDSEEGKCYHSPRRESEPCEAGGKKHGKKHSPCHNGLTCSAGKCKQLEGDEDCLALYNPGICKKMEKLGSDMKQGNTLDKEEFRAMKQLMKEARPVKMKQKDFKEKAEEVLKAHNSSGTKKDLLLEIVAQLDGVELQEQMLMDLERGFSEPDADAEIDPHAGEMEDAVSAPVFEGSEGSDLPNDRHLGVAGVARYWPDATIPYVVVYENDLSGYYAYWFRILPAMNTLEELTGLNFEFKGGIWTYDEAIVNDVLYVKINEEGCWANIGAPTGDWLHAMNIGSGCLSNGIILHELLHVAGMGHQQTGCYRDNYVTINDGNIQSGKENNFRKRACTHGYEWLYDYGSIMHYGEYGFSTNGGKTIDCRGAVCGQRSGLSLFDQLEIMAPYFWGLHTINTAVQAGSKLAVGSACSSSGQCASACCSYCLFCTDTCQTSTVWGCV
jgi:hypothetical protein